MNLKQLSEEVESHDVNEFLELLNEVKEILREERGNSGLFRLKEERKAIVVGDLHGDLESLFFILKDSKFLEKNSYLIFLGDYGDRGEKSPEVYYSILRLKERFPERVALLRGNHEFPEGLEVYPHDLPFHLIKKYGEYGGREIYESIRELFDLLYNAAILEGKYLFLHGGLPVRTNSIEDIEFAHEKYPKESFLEEILWNDPAEGITGYYPSPRGAGKIFGEDVTERVLERLGVKVLIRSHEPCEGFRVNHDGKILTLFSRKGAPYFNYSAAYLELNAKKEIKDVYKIVEEDVRKF